MNWRISVTEGLQYGLKPNELGYILLNRGFS